MNEKIIVEFTKEQVSHLIQLLDLAIKTGGLQVAPIALSIIDTIDKSNKETQVK